MGSNIGVEFSEARGELPSPPSAAGNSEDEGFLISSSALFVGRVDEDGSVASESTVLTGISNVDGVLFSLSEVSAGSEDDEPVLCRFPLSSGLSVVWEVGISDVGSSLLGTCCSLSSLIRESLSPAGVCIGRDVLSKSASIVDWGV